MRVRLPIHEGAQKCVDEIAVPNYHGEIVNGYVDELGNINRWPGFAQFVDTGESEIVNGLFWEEEGRMLVIVANGKMFWVNNFASPTASESVGDDLSSGNSRVSFAEYSNYVYAANNSPIVRSNYSGTTTLSDADAPTSVTHLGVLNKRLYALNPPYVYYSATADPTSWDGSYLEAEASADYAQAMGIHNQTLTIIGTNTVEHWYDNDGTPTRVYQGVLHYGTQARYTFQYCDTVGGYCYLDRFGNLVLLKNGVEQVLSGTFIKYLQTISQTISVAPNTPSASDNCADYIEIGGRPYYILQIPTAAETFAYDFISQNWYRLASYSGGAFGRHIGSCYCYSPSWNAVFMGDYSDGIVHRVREVTHSYNSATLRVKITSAAFNHGLPLKRKFCNGVYFRFKATQYLSTSATPQFYIRYRDNGSTTWTTARTLSLQTSNIYTDFTAYATRLGSYYSRVWEIYWDHGYPFALVSMEEDIDVER